MKIRLLATAACLGFGIAGTSPAVAAVAVTDDPVLFWNQVLLTGLAGSPTVTSRGFAMVEVALHDAVNATTGGQNNAYLGNLGTPGGDTRAAASKAARDVLVHLNPNPAKVAEFEANYQASLALVPDGPAKTNGIATGAAVAAATIANRTGDGSTATVSYAPSGLPGRWAPTPPANAAASLPQWAAVNPWLIASGDQFRPGAPPAITSAEYTAAFNEVKTIGSASAPASDRSAEQTASANYWAGAAGTGPWLQAAMTASEGRNFSSLQYASMFALLSTSMADAGIATWDAKYTYDYWRPITAIRGAGADGNPDTIADAGWTSLIAAPPHPSYVSAHAAVAGAAATTLSFSLGDDTDACFTGFGCFDSFDLAAQNAADSRLWGGIHWRFDNETGLALGRSAATYGIGRRFFAVVPEPSTWAMMIIGFGAIGYAMRRRPAARLRQMI